MTLKHELNFHPAAKTPEHKEIRETFLVVHAGDGYCLGRAFYDDDKVFVCFITDADETLHQGEYLSWASLPKELSILESL